MTADLQRKRDQVVERLRSLGSALIAYSGGVDSALLLALAVEALGERAVAFTALSPAVPADELEGARALARELGARHVEKRSGELEDPRYARNPVNRCYFCKTELYSLAAAEAAALGVRALVSGTNADELAERRHPWRGTGRLGRRRRGRQATHFAVVHDVAQGLSGRQAGAHRTREGHCAEQPCSHYQSPPWVVRP